MNEFRCVCGEAHGRLSGPRMVETLHMGEEGVLWGN